MREIDAGLAPFLLVFRNYAKLSKIEPGCICAVNLEPRSM